MEGNVGAGSQRRELLERNYLMIWCISKKKVEKFEKNIQGNL